MHYGYARLGARLFVAKIDEVKSSEGPFLPATLHAHSGTENVAPLQVPSRPVSFCDSRSGPLCAQDNEPSLALFRRLGFSQTSHSR